MILGDNTYYVSSSTTSAADCPKQCHPLSYYTTNTTTYFTSNATFIFMEGEHLLHHKTLPQVVVNDVSNLTLRSHHNINTDLIIQCSHNTHGLAFNNGNVIIISGIAITGCGYGYIPPLSFTNIAALYIHQLIMYNNFGSRLVTNNLPNNYYSNK